MLIRAVTAFLVLPGTLGFILPIAWLRYAHQTALAHPSGLIVLASGLLGLILCVKDFYVSGRGTLAPWSPPRKLVIVGLYRYSRNPMYVSVALILLGWTISFGSLILFIYTIVIVAAFHLRVILSEEPWLSQMHGTSWNNYAARVPRWFWRIRHNNAG